MEKNSFEKIIFWNEIKWVHLKGVKNEMVISFECLKINGMLLDGQELNGNIINLLYLTW